MLGLSDDRANVLDWATLVGPSPGPAWLGGKVACEAPVESTVRVEVAREPIKVGAVGPLTPAPAPSVCQE